MAELGYLLTVIAVVTCCHAANDAIGSVDRNAVLRPTDDVRGVRCQTVPSGAPMTDNARLELEKEHILKSLALPEVPVVSERAAARIKMFKQDWLKDMRSDVEAENYVDLESSDLDDSITEISVVPQTQDAGTNGDTVCPEKGEKASKCFKVSSDDRLSGWIIHKATLHVYYCPLKNENSTEDLRISWFEHSNTIPRKSIIRISKGFSVGPGRGWYTVELNDFISQWQNEPDDGLLNNRWIEIRCVRCNSDDFMPITIHDLYRFPLLTLSVSEARRRRKKRRACVPSQDQCCVVRRRIDFTELGWDWIIEPRTYMAGFCEGSCRHVGSTSLSKMQIEMNHRMEEDTLQYPCCCPVKWAKIPMIYFDGETIISKRVPLVVTSCDC